MIWGGFLVKIFNNENTYFPTDRFRKSGQSYFGRQDMGLGSKFSCGDRDIILWDPKGLRFDAYHLFFSSSRWFHRDSRSNLFFRGSKSLNPLGPRIWKKSGYASKWRCFGSRRIVSRSPNENFDPKPVSCLPNYVCPGPRIRSVGELLSEKKKKMPITHQRIGSGDQDKHNSVDRTRV